MYRTPVVEKVDSAIYLINLYPKDRYYWGNQLRYPLQRDCPEDSAIHLFKKLGPDRETETISSAS